MRGLSADSVPVLVNYVHFKGERRLVGGSCFSPSSPPIY